MTSSRQSLAKLNQHPDSNIPELGKDFWEKAAVQIPRLKKAVSIRLDDDLLDWFKQQGPGYQTKINAVLKSYMKMQQS